MDKYEYKHITFTSGDPDSLINGLNQFGAEGWHVVAATPCGYYQVQQSSMDGWRRVQYDILLERKIS